MRWRGNACLLLTAFIWGTTFAAQSVGMDRIGPFGYGAARFFLGGLALGALWLLAGGWRRARGLTDRGFAAGVWAGLVMFVASALQQCGLQYTTVGKASFLTCLYIVLVPIFGGLLGQRARAEHWAGAGLSAAGLYLLCVKEGLSLGYGDALEIAGAFFWTAHILCVNRFAARADAIGMSLAQVIVVFALNTAAMLAFEPLPPAEALTAGWFPIFYGGVMSTGVAYTLQIVGQREAEPAAAAIIMSLESVFGALAGWAVLGQALSAREAAGCALMAAGMVAAQAGGFMRAAWKRRAG